MSYYCNIETALSKPFGMQKPLWHHQSRAHTWSFDWQHG